MAVKNILKYMKMTKEVFLIYKRWGSYCKMSASNLIEMTLNLN